MWGVMLMIAYSIIMFLTGILFLVMGIAVYRGNTGLIHDYHQTNIKESERREYGRRFSIGLFAICTTLLISGIIGFFGKEGSVLAASLVVLGGGLIVSIVILVKVQKRYNGGLF